MPGSWWETLTEPNPFKKGKNKYVSPEEMGRIWWANQPQPTSIGGGILMGTMPPAVSQASAPQQQGIPKTPNALLQAIISSMQPSDAYNRAYR